MHQGLCDQLFHFGMIGDAHAVGRPRGLFPVSRSFSFAAAFSCLTMPAMPACSRANALIGGADAAAVGVVLVVVADVGEVVVVVVVVVGSSSIFASSMGNDKHGRSASLTCLDWRLASTVVCTCTYYVLYVVVLVTIFDDVISTK